MRADTQKADEGSGLAPQGTETYAPRPQVLRAGCGQAGQRRRERASRLAQLTKLAVAQAWHIPEAELKAATRRRADVAAARQIAMYLCHVVFGLSFAEVGRQFLRDRTTVAYACECIEDRRDDPDFDVLLDRIELAMRDFSKLGDEEPAGEALARQRMRRRHHILRLARKGKGRLDA